MRVPTGISRPQPALSRAVTTSTRSPSDPFRARSTVEGQDGPESSVSRRETRRADEGAVCGGERAARVGLGARARLRRLHERRERGEGEHEHTERESSHTLMYGTRHRRRHAGSV